MRTLVRHRTTGKVPASGLAYAARFVILQPMKIAIIGAGLAGLSAARRLSAAGLSVVVLEKSGGLGGRIATRRSEASAFDHGAPLLHGLDAAAVADLGAQTWRDGWIGTPGNSILGRTVATGIDVRTRTTVTGLERHGDKWSLETDTGPAERFNVVLFAVPAPQARMLLGGLDGPFDVLSNATMKPGWAVMARFDGPVPGPGWRDRLAPPIGLALRNSEKPGRPEPEAWVLHADDTTALRDLEVPPGEMVARLVAAFRDQAGAPAPVEASAHRWRYARTRSPLGRPCLWDADLGLGLAGDWCLGTAAGDAVASGRALAGRVMGAE